MRERTSERYKKWALFGALMLGNFSLIASHLHRARLIFSLTKAVIIFAVMYFICRIVIASWETVNKRVHLNKEKDLVSIKTTMEALDDLDEKGVKVTYHPLLDRADSTTTGSDGVTGTAETITPGQINPGLFEDLRDTET